MNSENKKTMGVLLPHTKLYGGVKRFLELGNAFVRKGHRFIVFTPDAKAPDWFDYHGEMATFDDIASTELDALWTTTVEYIPMVKESRARHKIFYHVRIKEKVKRLMKDPEIEVYACSTNVYDNDLRKFGKETFKAIGGVTASNYRPRDDYKFSSEERPFVVMAYGRLAESVKGTKYAVRACERLYRKGYNVKLLLYDTPTTEKGKKKIEDFRCKCPYEYVLNHPFDRNSELFNRADVFVSAENPRYSGWNNSVSEAMACGLPVIATIAGTADLLEDEYNGLLVARRSRPISSALARLYESEGLRIRLGKNARRQAEKFDWDVLADRILAHLDTP